jgi:hypothetical protein
LTIKEGAEEEEIYQRALHGYEKALGAEHTSTLDTVTVAGMPLARFSISPAFRSES